MISFLFFTGLLILGYLIYGKIAEKVFVIRPEAETPAFKMADGVDYVPLPKWKLVLLQFINIAGPGPIFGAIAGALFGPAAFAWIVFGCIFAGAVHDYTVSMLSLRNNGKNIADIVGKYLGKKSYYILRVFSLVMLTFIAVVSITTPALVLSTLFAPGNMTFIHIVIAAIILYCIIATMLPINKLMAHLYPLFGASMIFMGIGIAVMLVVSGDVRSIPEFSFTNFRPDRDVNILARVFPFLFITIACGAISGFHATQAPITSRCIKNEKEGRSVYYGAMILEGFVAMIWAAVTMGHFNVVGVESAVAAPVIVTQASFAYLGAIGGALAVIGVAVFPLSSGDTAFRAQRMILADALKLDQKPIKNRLILMAPLFAAGIPLVLFAVASAHNFNIIWRYFAWSNQTLATIGLWAASAYLAKTGKVYWLTLAPATFMTAVITSYFFTANETVGPMITTLTGNAEITYGIGLSIGIGLAITLAILFIVKLGGKQKEVLDDVM